MIARVRLWGRTIGAVSLDDSEEVARFQYDPEFVGSRIELSPLTMPLGEKVFEFPTLRRESFRGLPGMLADALPDRFGNALIDAWLATPGPRIGFFRRRRAFVLHRQARHGSLGIRPGSRPTTSHHDQNRDRLLG